ncbi:hypothetical protein CEXT_542441 [Caerostris extrusa]|uniref:Uncharacterized protein n=1 Tax=Caerostris extrusa TaxID=172846 RepID=A0AAV4NL29_CAEEX|nr:hypothetical protein CEXT_542441 [Caerostris extrusa]
MKRTLERTQGGIEFVIASLKQHPDQFHPPKPFPLTKTFQNLISAEEKTNVALSASFLKEEAPTHSLCIPHFKLESSMNTIFPQPDINGGPNSQETRALEFDATVRIRRRLCTIRIAGGAVSFGGCSFRIHSFRKAFPFESMAAGEDPPGISILNTICFVY